MGVKADNIAPQMPQIALVKTTDKVRSSRATLFRSASLYFRNSKKVSVKFFDSDKQGVEEFVVGETLFGYQTGLAHVPQIQSNTFIPVAFADHLT